MTRLRGKSAIVTGGASGIGEATVRRFVAEGAKVLFGDIDMPRGTALAEEIGPSAIFRNCDVTSESDISSLVDAGMNAFGRVDIMFNNAGLIGAFGSIDSIDIDAVRKTIEILVLGQFAGIKHAARVMKTQQGGSIITTGSIASILAGYGPHAYTAAKSALLGLTRSVATELGPHNIRVNLLCPGGTVTPMNLNAMGGGPEADQALRGYLSGMQPLPFPAEARDMADAALWLASDEARFVSGHALIVDGAATAGLKWNPIYEGHAA